MAKIGIWFEDKDGRVAITIEHEGEMPEHPRRFTPAHECVDGVLKLMRSMGLPDIVTLTEHVESEYQKKIDKN